MSRQSIWIGFDMREAAAFAVAAHSARRKTFAPIPVTGLVLSQLQLAGLYKRPTLRRGAQLFDVISEAPMSTEFAISRFLVPHLAGGSGWALFMDSDVLIRSDLSRLFGAADSRKAVMCVKHRHAPVETVKMDGQAQLSYPRKNWSSVMLFNLDHPANRRLTPELVNSVPGRDLHAFCWLGDEEIGELPPEWNYLVGHTTGVIDPAIVHFTDGFPMMAGYEDQPYADEWRRELAHWAGARLG